MRSDIHMGPIVSLHINKCIIYIIKGTYPHKTTVYYYCIADVRHEFLKRHTKRIWAMGASDEHKSRYTRYDIRFRRIMCGNVICQRQTIANVHETRVHFFKKSIRTHSLLNGMFLLCNINYYLVVMYAMYKQFINCKTYPERGAKYN